MDNDLADLTTALEESKHLVTTDPGNRWLVRSYRLLRIACRAARNQKWFRCWRFIDLAIPGFCCTDCQHSVSARLIHVWTHLNPSNRIPQSA